MSGAAGQLGEAICSALLARGAFVVASDRTEAMLAPLARLAGDTGRLVLVPADVTDDESVHALVERAAQEAGRLVGLVAAHGSEGPVGPVETLDIGAVLALYDVNVFGVLRLIRAMIPRLRTAHDGRIVTIASGAGLAGSPNMAAYSSSKHAVVGLTRSVAGELAGDGISVNAICPGCVESPMMNRIEAAMSVQTGSGVSWVGGIPMGRYARPEEIGELAAYFMLDAPGYITGTAIVIDGGMRA